MRVTDQSLAELEELAELVHDARPRFFAICGIYEGPCLEEGEDPRYVEWGMDFPGEKFAITWSPGGILGSLTKSGSPEQILKSAAKMGPAQLVWLDSE